MRTRQQRKDARVFKKKYDGRFYIAEVKGEFFDNLQSVHISGTIRVHKGFAYLCHNDHDFLNSGVGFRGFDYAYFACDLSKQSLKNINTTIKHMGE